MGIVSVARRVDSFVRNRLSCLPEEMKYYTFFFITKKNFDGKFSTLNSNGCLIDIYLIFLKFNSSRYFQNRFLFSVIFSGKKFEVKICQPLRKYTQNLESIEEILDLTNENAIEFFVLPLSSCRDKFQRILAEHPSSTPKQTQSFSEFYCYLISFFKNCILSVLKRIENFMGHVM